MTPTTAHPHPRGTNQYSWVRPIPFNVDSPFSSSGLGTLMAAGVTTPDASLYRYLISSGNYDGAKSEQAAGALEPIANPTNFLSGSVWYDGKLEAADMILIRPFMVIYNNATPTALAAAAIAGAIVGEMSFWLVKHARPPQRGLPMEYTADFVGQVTIANAATRIDSGTKWLPTGAQWCDTGTVVINKAIDPGLLIEKNSTGGAMRIRFDQEGAVGLIVKLSDVTAAAGIGWQRSHL